MDKKQLIEYLQHRIECAEAFLRDLYAMCSTDIVVVQAETELRVLTEVLNELQD